MPARPGCLYLMVTLLGDTIVVTPVAFAGSCLGLSFMNAAALHAGSSTEAAVLRRVSPSMMDRKLDASLATGAEGPKQSGDGHQRSLPFNPTPSLCNPKRPLYLIVLSPSASPHHQIDCLPARPELQPGTAAAQASLAQAPSAEPSIKHVELVISSGADADQAASGRSAWMGHGDARGGQGNGPSTRQRSARCHAGEARGEPRPLRSDVASEMGDPGEMVGVWYP